MSTNRRIVILKIPNTERHLLYAFEEIEKVNDPSIAAALYEINGNVWMIIDSGAFPALSSRDTCLNFLTGQFSLESHPTVYFSSILIIINMPVQSLSLDEVAEKLKALLDRESTKA